MVNQKIKPNGSLTGMDSKLTAQYSFSACMSRDDISQVGVMSTMCVSVCVCVCVCSVLLLLFFTITFWGFFGGCFFFVVVVGVVVFF